MTLTAELLVDCRCELGEGPFWHPLRHELFWFDINARQMLSATASGSMVQTWTFDEAVSAAAVVDYDRLALATETGLKQMDLTSGRQELVMPIEAEDARTRSNDSRVDRTGGFWIGTMRKQEDEPGGAVYRYRAGALMPILSEIKIPNAICFSPDGRTAYFSDTPSKRILKCPTDAESGLPRGDWTLFADVSDHRGYPDGAVTDSEGFVWNARWGGSCVVRHAPDGAIDRVIELPVSQVTCPAFGGPDYKTLFITSASKTLSAEQLAKEPRAGSVFAVTLDVPGLPEPAILL
ncbi:SMP-30/gluconolactonase/LRE family protein [Devosia nitrariae]|uniref:Gluconolactonase n=1 Tax=Devosia nitrariae TaxID=2071872 RepID=A0ABQ5WCX3_9HYPH|nr:SMP-30/gluconolactonase/LRE family protein [Devosia nitrariae]GLQ57807.1 gluconolactonase [Devosia nitrariae]